MVGEHRRRLTGRRYETQKTERRHMISEDLYVYACVHVSGSSKPNQPVICVVQSVPGRQQGLQHYGWPPLPAHDWHLSDPCILPDQSAINQPIKCIPEALFTSAVRYS